MSFLNKISAISAAVLLASLGAPSLADIENTATASAGYGTTVLASEPSMQAVPVVEGQPNLRLYKKIAGVDDTNASGRVDAGDTVKYEFEVYNTGNITLETIQLTDPGADIPVDQLGPLLPGASNMTLTAEYELKQSDVDAGGYENSALATATPIAKGDGTTRAAVSDVSDAGDDTQETAALDGTLDNDPTNDPTVLEIERSYSLSVAKTYVSAESVFPYVYDVTYKIEIENTGNVTAKSLSLTDDVYAELAPATLQSATAHDMTGFGGTGQINAAFNGNLNDTGVTELFESDVELAPNQKGSIQLTARLEFDHDLFNSGTVSLSNTANASADGFANAVASHDPTTGGIGGGGTTPTFAKIVDADNDGTADHLESSTEDHDGDGIANAQDYDPSGYFYCEETGAIMAGGLISPVDSFGSSANIRMVHDASTGYYQWFATAPGLYTMNLTYPSGGVPSTDRLPQPGPLVLATLTDYPTYIGSGEFGSTGRVADFSAAANPFYTTFQIAAGDPHVHNNNIPMKFCGTSTLAVDKTIESTPILLADGRQMISYKIVASNTGTTRSDNIVLKDDLVAAFGSGRFEVSKVELSSAPTGFTAAANSGYNGASNTSLLTTGGQLEAGESATVIVSLIVDPAATGTYTNIATLDGVSPYDGSALTQATSSVDIILRKSDIRETLLISKSSTQKQGVIGDTIDFLIVLENTALVDLTGLTLVDALPKGMIYTPNTARMDGAVSEPSSDGRNLAWSGLTIPAGSKVSVTLRTRLTSEVAAGAVVNQAWATATASGKRVTEIAEAKVTIITEPVFHCGDLIGKIFDDKNGNGRQDQAGEDGLPNVRVTTATGTVITTDKHGRFSVPCAELPDRAGANFTLKVDTRSLPTGYRVTTENPRTMRMTPGIFTEMNFGASIGRVVKVDLTEMAFDQNGDPSKALHVGLQQLLQQVANDPTVIQLGYYRDGETRKEAQDRLDAVETLIHEEWQRVGTHRLQIERTSALAK